MRNGLTRIGVLAIAIALGGAVSEPLFAGGGTVRYTLPFNVLPEEGTIEFWVKYEPRPGTRRPLLRMHGQDGGVNWADWVLAGPPVEGRFRIDFNPRDKMLPIAARGGPGTPITIEDGGWTHFAFAWRGKWNEVYVNGESAGTRNHAFTLADVLGVIASDSVLVIGNDDPRGARRIIDDLRISTVVRAPAELGFAVGELRPDPYNAVLDTFEETFVPDGERTTTPAVIFFGRGGVPDAKCRFVEGRFGRGLALWVE